MAISNCLLLLCLALLMAMAAATQFKVGGSMGWTVPTDPNAMSYNQWAERNRFQMGDTLLFVYPPDKDSVLQVSQDAYNTCNTSSYIVSIDDGNTVFTLDRSGPFYFISGVKDNCLKNESMVVVVLADRSNRASGSHQAPSMPPSPPPPMASSSPPSQPPPSPTEVTPSSAPTGGESRPPPPRPNGASLKVVSFMGSIGTFLGSLLFVL